MRLLAPADVAEHRGEDLVAVLERGDALPSISGGPIKLPSERPNCASSRLKRCFSWCLM